MKTILQVNEQICLRQIELADAERIFTIIDEERDYFGRWLPFVAKTNRVEDTQNFIRSLSPQEQTFTIRLCRETVGVIGLYAVDSDNLKLEIGYWLKPSVQKRGIMTSSVITLINYLFQDLHFNCVRIKCEAENLPSRRIPERLGFVKEGIERQGSLLPNNKFADLVIYSLLALEWDNKKGNR